MSPRSTRAVADRRAAAPRDVPPAAGRAAQHAVPVRRAAWDPRGIRDAARRRREGDVRTRYRRADEDLDQESVCVALGGDRGGRRIARPADRRRAASSARCARSGCSSRPAAGSAPTARRWTSRSRARCSRRTARRSAAMARRASRCRNGRRACRRIRARPRWCTGSARSGSRRRPTRPRAAKARRRRARSTTITKTRASSARSARAWQLRQNFTPADGRVLPIASNEATFSLLGIQFGGDGTKTFALPTLTPSTKPSHVYVCTNGVFPARD